MYVVPMLIEETLTYSNTIYRFCMYIDQCSLSEIHEKDHSHIRRYN